MSNIPEYIKKHNLCKGDELIVTVYDHKGDIAYEKSLIFKDKKTFNSFWIEFDTLINKYFDLGANNEN